MTTRRWKRWGGWVAALALASMAGWAAAAGQDATSAPRDDARHDGAASTLVLYDEGGPWGWMGELYAASVGNLVSHFGRWRAMPVGRYRAGDLARHDAAVYVGSTYDEPLPAAFLTDVLEQRTPVLWVGDNLWALARHAGSERFQQRFGFLPGEYDPRRVEAVRYKGVELTRDAVHNDAKLVGVTLPPAGGARVLATGVARGGGTLPWAVRGGHLTFVAENPLTYATERDRYLAFCDLLFDLLAPGTPERHRALVRIEDVLPTDDPARLRALADALAAEGVPFAVAVIPVYVDPRAAYSDDGRPQRVTWSDVPEAAAALRYMVAKGGTLVMHGYTHQLGTRPAPYTGVSGDDFEFWTAHVDANDRVVLDGPAPGDSEAWALDRARRGLRELERAGLGRPAIFEYPHYAGSAADSRALAGVFPNAYHRGLYFAGVLGGEKGPPARSMGQFFPYEVNDAYGWHVLPENLGNYSPKAFNGHPPRLPDELVANARANRVVRDGFASFFFHGYYDPAVLVEIVRGIREAGFTFVGAASLAAGSPEPVRAAAREPRGARQ
ncbi:DUF2334 domain-containing protein [Anaeromyxobacter dehalogenans]|uniref:DUF2334 domain-containing protein n=1 Tax=Anaeromyxobacter dehalogenans TaxID=161493 RepID=UPI001FE20249|nr:polysaccharide deacetylase family protein [Anaeromyxobacter dehalogenans]